MTHWNVLLVSPNFPPQYHLFGAALRARGVGALGVGEAPWEGLAPGVRAALDGYAHVPRLDDYDAVRDAVAGLAARYGPIARIESHNEHWLPLDARLRADFDVPGYRPDVLARHRSKTGMAEVFRAAGIPHPPGARVEDPEAARAFAADHGYPLVLKPDVGVGAARTYRVDGPAELEALLGGGVPAGYVVQPFVRGAITTYDGMTDRDGRIVFATSHVYDTGMMEVLTGRLDGYYYSRRAIPPALEAIGRRAVEAFGVRERFFHAEFFHLPDDTYVALEMNLRPPGGFTTDMMNYACDVDVYALWADAVLGRDLRDFAYARRYHVAHAGRRRDRRYRVPHDALVRELGATLVLHRPVPAVFATSMGDVMYLLRHPDERALLDAIARVQAPA